MYWCPSAVLNKGSDTCCDARTSCKYDSDCCKYLKIDAQFTNLGALIDNDQDIFTESQSYSIPLIGCLNTSKLIPGFILILKLK